MVAETASGPNNSGFYDLGRLRQACNTVIAGSMYTQVLRWHKGWPGGVAGKLWAWLG